VGYVVFENDRTFLGAKAADFPLLARLIGARGCERRRLGPFVIVTLRPPASALSTARSACD